jgi:hypothetical protein
MMSSPELTNFTLTVDWKGAVFLATTLIVFLNAMLLDRVGPERVCLGEGIKPVVMWVLCCFRVYFRFVIILAALAAFLTGLSALVIGMPFVSALAWIVVLLVVSFGTVMTHRYTIDEAVEWEVLSGK